MHHDDHFLLLNNASPLNVIQLTALVGDGLPILHENIANGKVRNIYMHFEWTIAIKKSLYWILRHCPLKGPVPDKRDRSPSEQCCVAGEATGPWQLRPVPERVCAGRDRSRAGRDGSRTLDFRGQAERPVPGRGDRSLWAKTAKTGLMQI
uniref:Uncharacterized protein n=1 Tax=Ananas comosus var. bracteatus TaxID=296719 RepID=A0A6V7NFC2_ANACO|nr:unnamed protein product [Ananas comosus var. bracteatus]